MKKKPVKDSSFSKYRAIWVEPERVAEIYVVCVVWVGVESKEKLKRRWGKKREGKPQRED